MDGRMTCHGLMGWCEVEWMNKKMAWDGLNKWNKCTNGATRLKNLSESISKWGFSTVCIIRFHVSRIIRNGFSYIGRIFSTQTDIKLYIINIQFPIIAKNKIVVKPPKKLTKYKRF